MRARLPNEPAAIYVYLASRAENIPAGTVQLGQLPDLYVIGLTDVADREKIGPT